MALAETIGKVPARFVAWAFVVLVAILAILTGYAIYAWHANRTLTLAGYEFGAPSVSAGAVIAYDSDKCPAGWTVFKPATARFIIGAGDEFETGYEKWADHHPLTVRGPGITGGAEAHMLSIEELPKHNHALSTGYSYSAEIDWHDGLAGSAEGRASPGNPVTGIEQRFGSQDPRVLRDGGHGRLGHVLEEVGGGKLHDSIPPFIALYFCKKEAG